MLKDLESLVFMKQFVVAYKKRLRIYGLIQLKIYQQAPD